MSEMTIIRDSINKLDKWITENDWKDYDPFDGLSSKVANFFTFNNHYLRIALQQSVRRFPINLRPILGIKKTTGSKGMGFCALGYLKLYKATRKEEYLNKMRHCLDWLTRNYSEGHSGYAWGNHFSYESRGGGIPLNVPTIVWTSLIANVFLDAYEALGESKYFEVAQSAGNFIVQDIAQYRDSPDTICFMYTPSQKKPYFGGTIHNSNVLGAWLLARLYQHTQDEELFLLAKKSVNFAVKYRLPHGGWYYGEPKQYHWEDNFHTGYNLESIYGYIKATGDTSSEDKLIESFKYYKSTFFREDGTPRYYNYKTYPLDIQCASQGIQTLVNLREYNPAALELAKKVALWTIKNMQAPKGFFYFRKYPLMINKTPMFHWGQATMLSALASLVEACNDPKSEVLVETAQTLAVH